MIRIAFAALLGGCLSIGGGCAHFMEGRAIDRFAEALSEKDLGRLKNRSSTRFEQKALRLAEALDDFEVLHLPDGKTSVVKVEEVSESERKVTVEVGEGKKKLLYKLVREDGSGEWVVDDIYVRQKRKGLLAARSVTEQMDLLLSVREFLAAWDRGERGEVLAVTTPRLQKVLAELPPEYLTRLTRRVIGEKSERSDLRPKAELDGEAAIVTVSRSTGKMVLAFKQLDGGWKLDEAAVESAGDADHIASLMKLAAVLKSSSQFLTAYTSGDRKSLESVCTEKLYGESLAHADFRQVPLPAAVPLKIAGEDRASRIDDRDSLAASKDAARSSIGDRQSPAEASANYEVKLQDRRADFIVKGRREWLKLSLVREDMGADAETPARYLVEEVTLYDVAGGEARRLSSVFTSQAIAQVFSEALVGGELTMLQKASTNDFNQRVWSRLDGRTLAGMPLPRLRAGVADAASVRHAFLRIVRSRYEGPVTEIEGVLAGVPVTFVLQDRGGQVRVDDVRVTSHQRPDSLKRTLELMIPVRRFAAAVADGDIPTLQRTSSKDLNRLIWKQTRRVPAAAILAPKHLNAPLNSIETRGEEVMVTLGDDQWGAKVKLVTEYGRHVVDDALLVAGPLPEQRAEIKKAMRIELATGGMPSQMHDGGRYTARQAVYRTADGGEEDRAAGGGIRPVAGAAPAVFAPPEQLPEPPSEARAIIVPDESAFEPPP